MIDRISRQVASGLREVLAAHGSQRHSMVRHVHGLALLLTFSAVVLAAGCGGSGSTGVLQYTAPTTPSTVCQGANGAQIALVSPANSATGVSRTLSQVVIAGSGALQSSAFVLLVPYGSTTTSGSTAYGYLAADSAGLPSGGAAPSFAQPQYYASQTPGSVTLPSGNLISAFFADSAQSCTPQLLGTFTTQ